MQINIATGNSIINSTQDNIKETVSISSKKEKLERRIRVLKRHLDTNETDEDTKKEFMKEIQECEEKLSNLDNKRREK